jgi:hypothetical protein
MIDYSVPNLSFYVGTFDCSPYLDEIALRLPHHEPGQIITWGGDFQVSRNIGAIGLGLTGAEFSEIGAPNRWRPGQQQVRLSIRGRDFPVLRIEQYRWNEVARTGKGRLVQVLDILNADRPDLPTSLITKPPRVITAGKLDIICKQLLQLAAESASISVIIGDIPPISGTIQVPQTPRNPISDAQGYAGLSWRWLAVDAGEQIYGLSGAPEDCPIAFTRADADCEVTPNLEALEFASPRVIVSGSTFVDAPVPCAEPPDPSPNADQKGRPTKQFTKSLKPFSEVFPGGTQSGYIDSPTLAEEKTILYAYEDRRQLEELLPSELQPEYNAVIGLTFGLGANEPIFTATIKRQPFGFLFPDAGTNTSMTIGEAIVETPKIKAIWKPRGVLSGLDQDATLILASKEELTSKYLPTKPTSAPQINPKTGTHTCFEEPPKKEDPQIAPEKPLKEIPIVGQALAAYPGWAPIINNPLIINFGFLPDVGVANNLARQIARREERRRDSWLIKMPIPDEWGAIGYRPLALCQIGTRSFQVDAPVVSIKNGEAYLEFEGGLLGVPTIEQYEYLFDVIFAADATLALGAIQYRIEYEFDAIASVMADLLFELPAAQYEIDSTSEFIASDFSPLIYQADILHVLNAELITPPIITLSVSPTSILEGSIILPIITLSVSPTSILEGT